MGDIERGSGLEFKVFSSRKGSRFQLGGKGFG